MIAVASRACGLTDLASCLPEKLVEYMVTVLNAPLQPLLKLVKSLLSEPVNLSLFSSIWAVMVYVISLFYGLLLLYAGIRFMVSGHDVQMREDAKSWLRNIFLMVIFIQGSFFLYSLVLEINSSLTVGVLNLLDRNFFLLTIDNLPNIGMELLFSLGYVIQLLLAVVLLLVRYLLVAVGVVLLPFGIFFFFIPPLRPYGTMVMYFFGSIIFLTFLDAIIFLVGSQLLNITLFKTIKILVMTSCFAIANFLMFYLMLFAALKAVYNNGSKVAKIAISAAKYIA